MLGWIICFLLTVHLVGGCWMAYQIVFTERLDYSIGGLLIFCQLWPVYLVA